MPLDVPMKLTDFFEDIGRWYAYAPRLAICLGGSGRAIFVLNLLNRLEQTTDPRGVYKTPEEVGRETGLSKYEQQGVRRALKTIKVLKEHHARLEHRVYFSINKDKLNDLWVRFSAKLKKSTSRNRKNRFREKGKINSGGSGKVNSAKAEKSTPIKTVASPPLASPIASPPIDALTGFDLFWVEYPRKVGKGKAREAWKKIHPNTELGTRIMAALAIQKGWPQWRKDRGTYIPNPATWLNQSRWEDEGLPLPTPSGPMTPPWEKFK